MDDDNCFHLNSNSIHFPSIVKVSRAKRNSNGIKRGRASRVRSRAAEEVLEIDQSATEGGGMGGAGERGTKQCKSLEYRTKSAQIP